jgi:F-type H+-transporting ATPase subunit epsilon
MSDGLPARLHLKVITPRLVLAEADATAVSIPSTEGLLGICPGHRPLMVALGEGELSYTFDGSGESFQVRGGYAEVQPDRVLVFTELAPGEGA